MHAPGAGWRHDNASRKGSIVPFATKKADQGSDRANARDLAYPAPVRTFTPLLATCVLCLTLPGCKSDPSPATDAATNDTPPVLDLPAEAPGADGPSTDRLNSEAGGDATCSGWTALKRLSAAEVSTLLATSDPIVINVHIPYAGDIPGTDTSIPYNQVDAIEAYLNYDHCADVVLICLSGGMSNTAGTELVNRGYLRVRDLNGGMNAWEAAGYTLLKDGGP